MASKINPTSTHDSAPVKSASEDAGDPEAQLNSVHPVTPAEAAGIKRGKPVGRPKGAGARVKGHKRTGTTRSGRATVNVGGGKARTPKGKGQLAL